MWKENETDKWINAKFAKVKRVNARIAENSIVRNVLKKKFRVLMKICTTCQM